MRPKHVLTALAIFAVTGAVSVPSSLAGAWRLDVSDRHVVDRGGLEGDPLIYTQLATGVPPDTQLKYDYVWPGQTPEHGARQDTRSDHKTDSEFGSYNNPFQKESPGSLTAPFRETIYGQSPATPSADPLVRELSRDPSIR